MNKIIAITTIFLLVLIACDNKKETDKKSIEELGSTFDSTELPTTELEEKEELDKSFFMNYKFKPGELLKYRMSIFSRNDQHIEADTIMDNSIEQTLIYLIDFKTLSVDEDSVAEIQCTVRSINLEASGMGNEVSYQSGAEIDSTELAKFAEHESFINYPFSLRVNKNGRLIEIYKIDKIMNRFLSLRGLEDSVRSEDLPMLKQDLSDRVIKPFISQIIREVPNYKMSIDSSWTYKRQSIPVMTFSVDYTNLYKIGKVELFEDEKVAVIDGAVETKVTGDNTYSEGGVNYQFEKPISSASGKIYFNLDRGLIQKSRTETKMENAFTVEMPTPQGIQKGNTREVTINVNVLELL
jgi:hypothetical protein